MVITRTTTILAAFLAALLATLSVAMLSLAWVRYESLALGKPTGVCAGQSVPVDHDASITYLGATDTLVDKSEGIETHEAVFAFATDDATVEIEPTEQTDSAKAANVNELGRGYWDEYEISLIDANPAKSGDCVEIVVSPASD